MTLIPRPDTSLIVDTKRAALGGVLAVIMIAAGVILTGQISGAEARSLLEGALPAVRFFCSALISAMATILALMLTLLSLGMNVVSDDKQLSPRLYQRLKQIALTATIVLIGGFLVLNLTSLPISNSDSIASGWFDTIYYVTIGISALLGGGAVSVVLLLYNAIIDIICLLNPEDETENLLQEIKSSSS